MLTFNHAPRNYVCPFCLVVNGVENEHVLTCQADIVYQNEQVIAFVASHRFTTSGPNILVIPTVHFENIYELPVTYGIELLRAKKLIAFGLKHVYQCNGISTRQHNEPNGSQDVWHYHEHVTPRLENDILYAEIGKGTHLLIPKDERAKHAAKIRSALLQTEAEE